MRSSWPGRDLESVSQSRSGFKSISLKSHLSKLSVDTWGGSSSLWNRNCCFGPQKMSNIGHLSCFLCFLVNNITHIIWPYNKSFLSSILLLTPVVYHEYTCMAFARPVHSGHATGSVCKLCQNNEDPFLIIFCKFQN